MKKKIGITVFLVLLIISNVVITCAVDIDPVINSDKSTPIDDKLDEIRGHALAVIQVIGVSVASVMLIVLAIKYMFTAPNEKAEVKKHMIPFVVGAIFVFASVGIIEIIKQFAENMFTS